MNRSSGNQAPKEDDDLDAFLNRAEKVLGASDGQDVFAQSHMPAHRRLKIEVTEDRLEAYFETLFPVTTWAEIADALLQARICWGIDEAGLQAALKKAQDIGHVQRHIRAATGKPAIYKRRKEVGYPFLEGIHLSDSQDPLHLVSSIFRDIVEALHVANIETLRAYARPVVGVDVGMVLMQVTGEDEIEPGQDVFGKEIKTVAEEGVWAFKAGDGVRLLPDGSMVAERYGYVGMSNRFVQVLSPIWISPDHMEAYFFNPSTLGKRPLPTEKIILDLLQEAGVRLGQDAVAIATMCHDLKCGTLRESCIRIAKGHRPSFSKGQIQFHFDVLPSIRFEKIQQMLQSLQKPNMQELKDSVMAVSAGQVLAEQMNEEGQSASGKDLFGEAVSLPESVQEKKAYKTGVHVQRETRDGRLFYVSEIYGYAGVIDNKISVLSPIWIAPDRMAAFFVAFSQNLPGKWPSAHELQLLLDAAHVRFGINKEVVANIRNYTQTTDGLICVAEGQMSTPGEDGRVTYLFKQLPDPGKLLESGKMDFREREGVPQVRVRDLLALRTLPKPGKTGCDVRGRLIRSLKTQRELLFAGSNVVMEEGEDEQRFYASGMGWARVIKDTLSVMQQFRHRGDVDFHVGNIKMEGDVEVEGSLKGRFCIEATGDVLIGGAVERRSQIIAGGNVVVKQGIVGAEIRAKGNLYARFIQDSDIQIQGDMLVRNYIQDSTVHVFGKAVIHGNEGGNRQLCLMGGELFAGKGIETASIGSAYGRATKVIAGIDLELEKKREKYQKGLAFADLQLRRLMRSLGNMGGSNWEDRLQTLLPNQKKLMIKNIQDLKKLRTLRDSLSHHLSEFQALKKDVAHQAQIRVHLSVFSKVSIQIADRHIELTDEINGIAFHLNAQQDAIVQEPIR